MSLEGDGPRPGEFNMSWTRPALSSLLRVRLADLIAHTVGEYAVEPILTNTFISPEWGNKAIFPSPDRVLFQRRFVFTWHLESDLGSDISWEMRMCTLYWYIIQKRRPRSCLIASHFYHHIVSGFSFVTHEKLFRPTRSLFRTVSAGGNCTASAALVKTQAVHCWIEQ